VILKPDDAYVQKTARAGQITDASTAFAKCHARVVITLRTLKQLASFATMVLA